MEKKIISCPDNQRSKTFSLRAFSFLQHKCHLPSALLPPKCKYSTGHDITIKIMNKYPEIQFIEPVYFITFVTWERLELSPKAREIVLNSFLFFHQQRYQIFTLVIMPDHVHCLIAPYLKKESEYWSIGSIMHSIKSYSAKQIPKVMNHIGKVWQDGRHERLIKSKKEMINAWKYIRQNPVKAELVNQPEKYPFFWELDRNLSPYFQHN